MSSGVGIGVVVMAVALGLATIVTGVVIVMQILSKPRKP